MSPKSKAMLYLPFFNMGFLMVVFGMAVLFVPSATLDSLMIQVFAWLYIMAGSTLIIIKLVWATVNQEEIMKMAQAEEKKKEKK